MNVRLTIRGRQFNVRTDEDGNELVELAQKLDQRLAEQASRSRSFDEHSVVVITALNILSEYKQLHDSLSARINQLEEELSRVVGGFEGLVSSSSETSIPDDLSSAN